MCREPWGVLVKWTARRLIRCTAAECCTCVHVSTREVDKVNITILELSKNRWCHRGAVFGEEEDKYCIAVKGEVDANCAVRS
jgi:hypothetical protein